MIWAYGRLEKLITLPVDPSTHPLPLSDQPAGGIQADRV